MVYRTSNSMAALLALLAGSFGPVQPAANAGDKIEFSAPSALLEVPKPEREIKQDPATAIREGLARHHTEGSDFSYSPPATTIIIPAQKSRDRFGWTAPFEEDRDQDSRSGLDLFASRKAPARTNSWNISSDSNPGFSKDDNGNWTRSDHDLSRFGTDATRKGGDRGEDRLTDRFDDRGVSDWFRTLDSHGPKTQERTRQEALAPGKEGFGAFYQQPNGGFSLSEPLSPPDPLHSSAYPSGNSEINWPDESLRGQSEQELQRQPSIAQGWDELPSATHPQHPGAREQTFSAPTRAPTAPAVLSFPKRPGDLFQ